MFEFDARRYRLAAHVFDGVLVAEPVGALDRVVHMPATIVLAHIAQRRRAAALSGDGMAARRENLGDAARPPPGLGAADRGAQPGPPGAHAAPALTLLRRPEQRRDG